MNVSDNTMEKIFALFTALGLLIPIIIVFASLAFYDRSYEVCLQDCREKYKFNIDNCWSACNERCHTRFNK